MKKNRIFSIIGIAFACSVICSCYDDEGNYDYVDLPRFEVDTVGVNTLINVTQFDVVDITPKLIYDGDKSELDYTWSAYTQSNYGYNTADTLANTESLHKKITLQPETYTLEFCAKNRNTGLRTRMTYTLNVESYSGPGLMVFYNNAGHCDVDIIRTVSLMGNISKNEVRRNLYTNVESNPALTGNPIGIGDMDTYLDLVTDQEAIHTTPADFSLLRPFNEMFVDVAPSVKPEGYLTLLNSGCKAFVNNGGVHTIIYSDLYPTARSMSDDSYYASPHTVFAYGMNHVVYDEKNCRFLYGGFYSGTLEKVSDSNLANMNRTLLTLHRGFTDGKIRFSNYAYGVMKDRDNDEQRALVVISAARSALDIKLLNEFNISDFPEITNATGYAFSEWSPLFYYTTANSLYVCPFSLDQNTITNPSEASWTCPAGETITHMQLFKYSGISMADSPSHKYLIVATYDGKNGKVYLLKTDLASGAVDATPVEEYSGFGKVGAIDFKMK